METGEERVPDRGSVATEQRNSRSTGLDELSVREFCELFVDDHGEAIEAVRGALGEIREFIEALTERATRGGRLIYLGAGTSGRLGVLDAAECPPTFQSDSGQVVGLIAGGDGALRQSSEGKEDDAGGAAEELERLGLTHEDCVLGIAAGGTTRYVLGGLEQAKRAGAYTGLMTCAGVPEGFRGARVVIHLKTGAEILTGSTRLKAGTATKAALNMISTCLFTRLGKVYSNLMVDVRATNMKLRDRAIRMVMEVCEDVDRAGAERLLDRAKGEVKIAVVMRKRKMNYSEARTRLAASGGMLREALRSG